MAAALHVAAPPSETASPRAVAPTLHLAPYDVLHAPLVASWARRAKELEWLAPATQPPLTAAKVDAWGRSGGHRIVLYCGNPPGPAGYCEINPMPDRPQDQWIGHFVLTPAMRGRGLGRLFFQAMLCRAFAQLGAREVLLIVSPDNVAAIQCYEASGMTPAGREVKYFGTRRRRFEFVRMTMSAARFRRWSREGRILPEPLPMIATQAR